MKLKKEKKKENATIQMRYVVIKSDCRHKIA